MSNQSTKLDNHRIYFNRCIGILRCVGILKLNESAPKYFQFFNNYIKIFTSIIVVIYTSSLIADAVVNYSDITMLANDVAVIVGFLIGTSKILTVYNMRDRFSDFIDSGRTPLDTFLESSDLGLLLDVKECTLYEAIDSYVMTIFTVNFSSAFVISSLVMGNLLSRGIFPFGPSTPGYYPIVFFIQSYGVIHHLIVLVTIDLLSFQLMRYTTLQLRVLSFNYINCKGDSLKPVSQNFNRDNIDKLQIFDVLSIDDKDKEIRQFAAFEKKELNNISDNFNDRFKICVKHHRRLIKLVNDFNETFSFSLMVQLGGSLLIMCLNGYMAVMFPDDREIFIKAMVYLSSGFAQLLYWCAFGNQLKFQADFLTSSQWMSGWEKNFDGGIKNLVTTAMIKTMQPLEIRAGGLFVLTMETFLSILKSSYSVFVLLTTTTD